MKLREWFKPKPKAPEAPKAPDNDGTLNLPGYLKLWSLLRTLPIKKLFPAVVSVSTVIFLAISGLVAWLVLVSSFVFRLFTILS